MAKPRPADAVIRYLSGKTKADITYNPTKKKIPYSSSSLPLVKAIARYRGGLG